MWDPTLICFLQTVMLAMAGAIIFYLFGKIREHRDAAADASREREEWRKEASDRQAAEKQTVAQKDWYQALFTHVPVSMVMVHGIVDGGLPGSFLEVNDVICARLGYSREELLARTPLDIQDIEGPLTTFGLTKAELVSVSDSYLSSHAKRVSTGYAKRVIDQVMIKGEVVYETQMVARDGKKIPVRIEARRLDVFDPPAIMAVAQDIGTAQQTEEALHDSQTKLRDFFTYSPFGIAMYDADKRLTQTNRVCLKMLGIPDEAALGKFSLLDNEFVPADIRTKINKGEWVRYETAISFDDLAQKGRCVTTRRGRGYFDLAITYMGYDKKYHPKGFLVHLMETTERRKLEAELRKMADKGAKEGTSGSLADMSFTDMIQIICAGGRSMQIDFTKGPLKAVVYIQNGDIIHCHLGDQAGDAAFYALMQWHDGEFAARQCTAFPERTIRTSLMSLLMEGSRQADEVSGAAAAGA